MDNIRNATLDGIKNCKGVDADRNAINSWSAIFDDHHKFKATVAKNYILHGASLKKDFASAKTDGAAKNFYNLGLDLGDAAVNALGPVNKAMFGAPVPSAADLPANAFPDLAAGFVKAMTGNDYRTEIQTCWDHNQDANLIKADEQIYADEKVKSYDDIYTQMDNIRDATLAGIKNCKDMEADRDAITKWSAIFDDHHKFKATVAKNYILHGAQLKKDFASAKTDGAAKNFFNLGLDLGDAAVNALGPVKKSLAGII